MIDAHYNVGDELTADKAMSLAIELAKRGVGFVSPNPLVGCVILDEKNRLISSGYHAKCGDDHAEAMAIKSLSPQQLKGAKVFVTLEPCSFEGRTPSCAKTLAAYNIDSVFYGVVDPHPAVAGSGLKILQDAGIKVQQMFEFEEECEELAEVFLHNQRHHLPFVALKVASSLDGQVGLASGESQWITGEEAREYGHYLRAMYDIILIGSGTFTKDNPSLNVRHPSFKGFANKVVLIDSKESVLDQVYDSNLTKSRREEDIFVAVSTNSQIKLKPDSKINLLKVGEDSRGKINLKELLEKLYHKGITSIFIEGGPGVYSSFLEANLVQRIYHFLAPSIIGAKNGNPWSKGLSIDNLSEQVRLKSVNLKHLGKDLLITGRID